MAAPLLTRVSCSSVIKTLTSGLNLTPVRLGTHRKLPTKKIINPFVQRRTDLIKRIVVALVQHERIQTTLQKAHDVQKYGDLLITLSQRRSPPPDLDMIENGYILNEKEALEKMVTKRIVNRRSKKVIIPPKQLTEEEFIDRCRQEASNMLMGNQEALDKLYGPLKERYKDRYGGFVQITAIPCPPKAAYPKMAYVELVGNELEPLPSFPVIKQGKIVVYGEDNDTEVENAVALKS